MPAWVLQFPIEKTRSYASRFPSGNDDAVLAMGEAARGRGHYTRDEFISVCKWKSERSRSHAARNTAQAIEAATRVALSEASTERERLNALRSLHGVEWATASVLLHLAYPERYPILDQRVLQALGVPQPSSYSFRYLGGVGRRVAAAARTVRRGRTHLRPGSLAVVEGRGHAPALSQLA